MDQDRREYLKREIKSAYKRYIGEITDEEATLLDVTKFFNIPIDESRLEDYIVKKIDYNIPSIEIEDKNNNITYAATYTGDADLLNFSGAMVFNSVVITSPVGKIETLYYIEDKSPIITKMTFAEGEYELVFEREARNTVGVFINDGTRMSVRYLQNIEYKGNDVKQTLFSRIYKNSYINNECHRLFEQELTYGQPHFIKKDDSQNKYFYTKPDAVIYGINELKQKGVCHYFRGICFENTKDSTQSYFPSSLYAKDYPLLRENDINSAMIFKVKTDDEVWHSLEIYKGAYFTSISYHSEKRSRNNNYLGETVANEEYNISNCVINETITSEEIQNIISSLQERIRNNVFTDIISNELSVFGTKIDIRKEIVPEELDPLSPKLLMDKSFEEIYNLVSANKNDYFRLISEQFETVVQNGRNLGKGQSRILEKKDS